MFQEWVRQVDTFIQPTPDSLVFELPPSRDSPAYIPASTALFPNSGEMSLSRGAQSNLDFLELEDAACQLLPRLGQHADPQVQSWQDDVQCVLQSLEVYRSASWNHQRSVAQALPFLPFEPIIYDTSEQPETTFFMVF